MKHVIRNKIEDAGLVTLDLTMFEVEGRRVSLDLANWLDNNLIIKEKSFRARIKQFDWSEMKNAFVAVFCSKDVIIPPWAYLLIQTKLHGIAKQVFFSDLETMDILLFEKN